MTSTNVYTDLIFDGTNHTYSLPRFQNYQSGNSTSKTTYLKCNKFGLKKKSCITALFGVMFVILVLSVCCLYAGYILGKHNCERQSFEHQLDNTEVSTRQHYQLNTSTKSSFYTTEQSSSAFRNTQGPKVQTNTVLLPSTSEPKATVDLDGKTRRIYRHSDKKHWHYDTCCHKYVSGIWQPMDSHAEFKFIQMTDGTFKIKSLPSQVFIFDGFGVQGANSVYLNGMDNTDDDHMRFIISMETDGKYRILTKATGRYVRMDQDLRVSSRFNLKDDHSLFLISLLRLDIYQRFECWGGGRGFRL